MHTHMNRPNSCLDWVLSHWAHSLCLDHFRVCMHVFCAYYRLLYVLGGWWRWALVSPDGVVPSWMINVSVSASVNLPLYHKVQKFSSGTRSPGWYRKKGHKTVVCVCVICFCIATWWDGPSGIEAWSLGPLLPSVLWHCWLGHLIHKNSSPIWPVVFSGTLNPTQSVIC